MDEHVVDNAAPESTPRREIKVSGSDDDGAWLVAFVRDRDAECPSCGYNLRDLTQPMCPECREPLRLTVGIPDRPLGWLFVTLVPCMFSGISAFILALPMVIVPMVNRGGGGPPPGMYLLDLFGWASGITGIVIFLMRRRFLRMPQRFQITWAIGVWSIHLTAFAVFVFGIVTL